MEIYKLADAARFVVQEHTTPEGVHWDLMLEEGGVLWTFRLPRFSAQAVSGPQAATKIFDHPLRFLTYEGPVQSNTGRVHIADRGTFEVRRRTDAEITLTFLGEILQGTFALTRIDNAMWTLAPSP